MDDEKKRKEEREEENNPKVKSRNLFDDISIRSKQDGIFRMPKELRDLLNNQKINSKSEPNSEPENIDKDTLG